MKRQLALSLHAFRAQRRLTGAIAAMMLAIACSATAHAHADDDDDHDHRGRAGYAIGLWGDLPYSAVQTEAVQRLIADMNSQQLKFSVHDGDLKAGSGRCDDIVYWQALDLFNALEAPAMFTPGDNDWTDCDRTAAGSFNSLERLDFERRLFCSTSYSIGKRHGDSHCFRIDKPYLDAAGRRLENFTRVETFGNNQANGANDVQWLKVWVDPRSREVFSYQPMIVPGNRVAVPAP